MVLPLFRHEWLAGTAADRTAQGWTLERWLRHWLDTRTKIRPTTRFHYTRDIENVLIPHLGGYRLADLDTGLLRSVFARIAATTNSKGRPQSAAAMQHLRTTLRAALNLAVRQGLTECNPARHIEISGYQPPHAKVWTDARVAQWKQTGDRPAVAVWTAEQLATFLGAVGDDSLFACWWLTALRGLRRGEMCGLRWTDIDLDRASSRSSATAPRPATR
jgi:integrase